MRYLAILLALPLAAQVTPSSPSVPVGGSQVFTSPSAVTWSLSGGGSLSTTGPSTSTTYTAPTSGVSTNHSMLGCPALPNDAIFNTRIDGFPVDANSAAKIATMQGGSGGFAPLQLQLSWGVTPANASTPTRTWKPYYASGTTLTGWPYPIANARENGNFDGVFGYNAQGATTPDHHMMTVRYDTCGFYDTYTDYLQQPEQHCTDNGASNCVTQTCGDGTTLGCNVQSAGYYSGLSYAPITLKGTDAAGLPLSLIWTVEEIKRGVPRHMVRMTWCAACFTSGNASSGLIWKFPATAGAGGCYSGSTVGPGGCSATPAFAANGDSTNFILQGTVARIKSGFSSLGVCGSDTATPTSTCSISGSGGICTTGTAAQNQYCSNMLTGLQQYGWTNADTGTSNALTPSIDLCSDPDVCQAVTMIRSALISSSNYEIVNINTALYSASGYQVAPIGAASYAGSYGGITYTSATQSYVTPANQVIITGGSAKASVAIQPIGIGTTLPLVLAGIQAGSGTLNLTSPLFWVTPSTASQSITWTVVGGSTCGTMSGSTYTAPASTSSAVSGCSLHGVAAADSSATADVWYSVFPAGTIRIDTGASSATTDGLGNTWQADRGRYGKAGNSYDHTGSAGNWTGNYAAQHATQSNNSADFKYTVVAAVGNYQVNPIFGQTDYYFPLPRTSWPSASYNFINTWNPQQILTNDQVVGHAYDWGRQLGYLTVTPWDSARFPARVTAATSGSTLGVLSMQVGAYSPETLWAGHAVISPYTGPNYAPKANGKANEMDGVQFIPDTTTTAHWEIDTQGQRSIASGKSLQAFFVTDWFTGDSDVTTPTWSIVSGPAGATINATTGVLSYTGTAFAKQPIIIKASGAAHSGQVTIYTDAARYLLPAL